MSQSLPGLEVLVAVTGLLGPWFSRELGVTPREVSGQVVSDALASFIRVS